MAEATAKRDLHTPNNKKKRSNSQSSPSLPPTPRLSTLRTSLHFDDALPPLSPATTLLQDPTRNNNNKRKKTPKSGTGNLTPQKPIFDVKTPKSGRKEKEEELSAVEFSPASPQPLERKKKKKKRKRGQETGQVFYKKVVYDGGEFEVGDDVYVKRRDDDDDGEMAAQVEEQCRVCFKSGKAVMIECDDCLGGFHLKCLKPPLKEVPETTIS